MNAFANSIFSILFSWLRSLLESLWRSVSSGSFSGLLTWLGDHWIPVAIVLCVICTVLDYLIWLIRWRPYVIWRQKIAKWLGRKPASTREEINFDRGYLGGVDIDVPESAPAPAQTWRETFFEPSLRYPAVPAESPSEPFADGAPGADAFSAPAPVDAPLVSPAAPLYQAPAFPEPEAENAGHDTLDSAVQPAARRRRSDRHGGRKTLILPEKLLAAEDEEDSLLNGLPPPVKSSDAFHRPVYPEKNEPAP